MNNINITVIKRNGKKVNFDGTKIALAIKKGFDSVQTDYLNPLYNAEDANKIYIQVIEQIQNWKDSKIKIEQIQDLIEQTLLKNNYTKVYESFSKYRERRNQSRASFIDEKKLHKFLKSLETLGLKSSLNDSLLNSKYSASLNTNTNLMFKFGSVVSQEFSKAYLLKKDYLEAHNKGDIYIHNLDCFPMGSPYSCQIDLAKVFENNFNTLKDSDNSSITINSYTSLATNTIQSAKNDLHGEQNIPAFDFYLSTSVLKTFKIVFQEKINTLLEYTDFDKFVATNGIEREINKLSTINFDISIFDKFTRNSKQVQHLLRIAYNTALKNTDSKTYQAIQNFIYNTNIVSPLSIGLGTDTSYEGRLITQNYFKVIKNILSNNSHTLLPETIFKIKQGINLDSKDLNYDLFKQSLELAYNYKCISFSFIDSSFNNSTYKKGNCNTEVSYSSSHIRILENVISSNKSIVNGRGNLSCTTLNLPRLGIKYGITNNRKKADLEGFYIELDEKLELIKNQLLDRFEYQTNKRFYDFPYLMQNHIWIDSEKLRPNDKLRRVLKHGTLSLGIIGLSECLKALTSKTHSESKSSQELGLKIVSHIRQKINEFSKQYNLNFTLMSTCDHNCLEYFIQLDKTIYGILPNITDKKTYTESFHISNNTTLSIPEKISIEGPYHNLTNGGHVLYLNSNKFSNIENLEQTIKLLSKKNIGYVSIIQ